MSFQQVFYTSCEEGLGGGKGFQVKAASPEIPSAVLQMVERLGLYVPPLSSPSRPTAEEIEQFPVSLIFQTLSDNSAVLGQAKYVGVDYTGRFGNFFTHSLISADPYADFCQISRILPIETWKSRSWVMTENDSTVLPAVERISTGGKIDFPNVQRFLQDAARREMLPRFLTAVVEALKTNRRIIIVDDNENIALWIAAAAYALPFHLVLKLTFNTYVRDPYQTEALIVGTTEDSSFNFAPHEIEYQFFVFDIKGGRFTAIEPNGFAAKSAFIYRQPYAETIAGFAVFVEEIAPELTIEELDDALATYCYFENLDLPGVDDVKVLMWCSGHLTQLAERSFDNLFGKVTEKSPVDAETLRAATDFYLAALDSGINTQNLQQIENLYFQWLLSAACRTADVDALAETAARLPRRVYLHQDDETAQKEWLKNLKDADTPARFAVMMQIGGGLGFLEEENELLRWLGKNVVGKWLREASIQESVRNAADRRGGKKLLEGVAEFLVEQIDDISLFAALSGLISDEQTYRILSNYAAGIENLPLYLRLGGAKANLVSEETDRAEALKWLLGDVQQIFRAEITAEIVQSAYNAVWLDRKLTFDEAVLLISPPLMEYVVKTDIPSQLVDLINPETEVFSPSQAELAKRLASNDIYHTLGDKAGLAQVYRLIAEMQDGFVDQDGEKLSQYLQWAAEHRPFIAPIAPRLYHILGRKFAKVKDVRAHSRKLPEYLKEPTGGFFKGYDSEIENVLRAKKNHLEIARLLRTWTMAAQSDQNFGAYLVKWSEMILKNQSRKDIENIEAALDPHTREVWTTIKEHLKEQDTGLFGRFFGGIFGRR